MQNSGFWWWCWLTGGELALFWNSRFHENLRLLYISRPAACWGNARHRPKHAATRLIPAGPPEAYADFFAAGAIGTNMRQWLSARRRATANDSSSSEVHRREG